ncbi:hypothetical protein [Thermofilum pendens]
MRKDRLEVECADTVAAPPSVVVRLDYVDPYSVNEVEDYWIIERVCSGHYGVVCVCSDGNKKSHPFRNVYVREYESFFRVMDEVALIVSEWLSDERRFASVTIMGFNGKAYAKYLLGRLGYADEKVECTDES